MAEMIEMQDFAEDTEQIPEENIDEAASDDDSETETAEAEEQADSEQSETAEPMPEEATMINFFRSLIFQRSARKKSAAPPAISCCRTAISGLTVFR